ncbi:MAG: hypothetical protein JSR39_09045 [Verrucomicrobia bacterium]|nr:hypothetical protein [Verrucomicrobiota bacterium]
MLKKTLFRSSIPFWTALLLFSLALVQIDRTSFKQNDLFNIRHILPNISANPKWEVARPTQEELANIDKILEQSFRYLAKGSHSFAFLSEDGRYVLKFHRYPSHLRVLPWLNRPFAYQFSQKRIKIKEYNLKKLDYNLSSYKNSFEDLKEETGLIYVHTNPSTSLNRCATIIDRTGNTYRIPLDNVTFVLQHRADLLYTTLDQLKKRHDVEGSKKVVSAMVQLFVSCCQKGYVDEDPILRKNYGIIGDRAIHIDIGDMVYREDVKKRENYIPHVKEMTESLRKRLVRDYPYLLDHYQEEIDSL